MLKLRKQLHYDIIMGGRQSIVFSIVMLLLFMGFVLSDYQGKCRVSYGSEISYSWLDCLAVFFRGVREFSGTERTQAFHIPVPWFCFHIGYLLNVLWYPYTDYKERGYQFLIRTQSRKLWWRSKCIWCLLYTLCYVIIFFTEMLLISIVLCHGHISWMGTGFPALSFYGWRFFGVFFLVVIFSAAAFSILEMAMSFLLNQLGALFVTLAVLTASAYWEHPLLLGNYSMLERYGMDGSQRKLFYGILISMAVITGAYIMGKRKVNVMESL